MSIELRQNENSLTIIATLRNEGLLQLTERGAIEYAIETIGKAIVDKFKDQIMKDISVKELSEMAKTRVAAKLAESVQFNIKKS